MLSKTTLPSSPEKIAVAEDEVYISSAPGSPTAASFVGTLTFAPDLRDFIDESLGLKTPTADSPVLIDRRSVIDEIQRDEDLQALATTLEKDKSALLPPPPPAPRASFLSFFPWPKFQPTATSIEHTHKPLSSSYVSIVYAKPLPTNPEEKNSPTSTSSEGSPTSESTLLGKLAAQRHMHSASAYSPHSSDSDSSDDEAEAALSRVRRKSAAI